MNLLKAITIPEWHWLIRKTRFNEKPIEPDESIPKGGGIYEHGHVIYKRQNEIIWVSLTIWDKYAGHPEEVVNFSAKFDLDGNFKNRVVNLFGLGSMPLDMGYVKGTLTEVKSKFCDSRYWDAIQTDFTIPVPPHRANI